MREREKERKRGKGRGRRKGKNRGEGEAMEFQLGAEIITSPVLLIKAFHGSMV